MNLAEKKTSKPATTIGNTQIGIADKTEKKHPLKLVKTKKKRITMDLPELAADTLAAYAEHTGRSKTEFVRASIGVFANLCDEIMAGNRVLVTGPDGKTLIKELILPS